jgi:hypothetical protein
MKKINLTFLILICIISFRARAGKENYLVRCNQKWVEVVMEDLFTPVVASRVHVYPNLAAYAGLSKKEKSLTSLEGKLTQFQGISSPKIPVDFSLAALFAFFTVAKKLVYSEYMITQFETDETEIREKRNKKMTQLKNPSIEYGKQVGQEIISWMKKDIYDYTWTLS